MMLDKGMPLLSSSYVQLFKHKKILKDYDNTNDTVKLLIDTGHMLFAQGNSMEVLTLYRLIHVHTKDIKKNIEQIINKRLLI